MDKRKKRTSVLQYNIYLKALESDSVFRAGIKPQNDSSAISRRWRELSVKLNDCPEGPKLEPDEWRKRFMDWKHATRAKRRKAMKPGADKQKIQFTSLEKQGIELWGPPSNPQKYDTKSIDENDTSIDEDQYASKQIETTEQYEEHDPDPEPDPLIHNGDDNTYHIEIANNEKNDENSYLEITNFNDDLKNDVSTTEVQPTTAVSQIDLRNIGKQLRRLADIKQEKLRFEIEKFKFRNPGFHYDYN